MKVNVRVAVKGAVDVGVGFAGVDVSSLPQPMSTDATDTAIKRDMLFMGATLSADCG